MMRNLRALAARAALLGVLAPGLVACSAEVAPSAPSAAPALSPQQTPSDLLGLDVQDLAADLGETVADLLASLTVFRCETPGFGTVTRSIGGDGGVIRIGPHSLHIPAGALSAPTQITATAAAGRHVRVDFQPEGLRFERPAILTLSYAHCPTRPVRPMIVYVDDMLSILELLPSVDDRSRGRVAGRLKHFSGYAFAD